MYHPTTRVLAVLELLQAHRRLSGPDLAARLEVDRRTVRRYITILQDLGIPIVAAPGRHGGYTLRANFKLPPLMFTEAAALALGLLAARRTGFAAAVAAVESALAKVERVLPPALCAQLLALQGGVTLDFREAEVAPVAALIASLGAAAHLGRRVQLRYRAQDHQETARLLDPYGVVYHAAIWYVVGHCHLRDATRTFRLDRILAADWCDDTATFTRPADLDNLDLVRRSLAATPRTWTVVATLHTTPELVLPRLPPGLATLEDTVSGVILRCSTDSLRWLAAILARLDCDCTIHNPSNSAKPYTASPPARTASPTRQRRKPAKTAITPTIRPSFFSALPRVITMQPSRLAQSRGERKPPAPAIQPPTASLLTLPPSPRLAPPPTPAPGTAARPVLAPGDHPARSPALA